jgi:hypothetical protein
VTGPGGMFVLLLAAGLAYLAAQRLAWVAPDLGFWLLAAAGMLLFVTTWFPWSQEKKGASDGSMTVAGGVGGLTMIVGVVLAVFVAPIEKSIDLGGWLPATPTSSASKERPARSVRVAQAPEPARAEEPEAAPDPDPAPKVRETPQAAIGRGWGAIDNDPRGALEAFDAALEQDESLAEAQYGRGQALIKLGRRQASNDALCAAVGDPKFGDKVQGFLDRNGMSCP